MLIKSIGATPDKNRKEEYSKRTKYFVNGKFTNMNEIASNFGKRSERSKERIPKEKVRVIHQQNIEDIDEKGLTFYWLGHSSLFIQMGKKNILIDPILTDYASPFSFVGVKRYSDVPMEAKNLPEIDVLFISHDHYDHLDYRTALALKDKVKHIVVPLGVECILEGWGFEKSKITSLAWWESVEISGISITATPSQHFSSRNPLHANESWWCGFCFKDENHCVYYSGDGGYSDSFKDIGNEFEIDLAFLECGQYDKAWPSHHMFPEQTVQAAIDVKSKLNVPIHWGAFSLCNSKWDDSVTRFVKEADSKEVKYLTPIIGERVDVE